MGPGQSRGALIVEAQGCAGPRTSPSSLCPAPRSLGRNHQPSPAPPLSEPRPWGCAEAVGASCPPVGFLVLPARLGFPSYLTSHLAYVSSACLSSWQRAVVLWRPGDWSPLAFTGCPATTRWCPACKSSSTAAPVTSTCRMRWVWLGDAVEGVVPRGGSFAAHWVVVTLFPPPSSKGSLPGFRGLPEAAGLDPVGSREPGIVLLPG